MAESEDTADLGVYEGRDFSAGSRTRFERPKRPVLSGINRLGATGGRRNDAWTSRA